MTAPAEKPHIGLVVEGPGDDGAVPVLLRRYLNSKMRFDDILGKPIPCRGRSNATKNGGIESFVGVAAARPGCVGILVVLDADSDLSCVLGPELRERALQRSAGKPLYVCLAEANFEDWLDADFAGLNLGNRPQVNSGMAAITEALRPRKYIKPALQPKLAHRIDVEVAAARNPSLLRLFGKLDELAALI